ncbi:MAG: hypothetical protein ABI809_00385 [Caldimonas sp.]
MAASERDASKAIQAVAAQAGAAAPHAGAGNRAMRLLVKLADRCRLVLRRYPPDPRVEALRKVMGAAPSACSDGPLVAVQCVEDPIYFGLFNALVEELRRTRGARGELVVVRSINGAIGANWRSALWRSVPIGRLIASQWIRASRPWIERVAYRSLSYANPLTELADVWRSGAAWLGLRSGDAKFSVVIDGVTVTDLIIDSFLRFRPSPSFEKADPFVLTLIRQAHRDVRLARAYFRRHRPRLYITSYSTYLEHGIAVRVALQEGVQVMSFGSLARFGKELTSADSVHTPNAEGFRREFAALDDQPARIRKAAARLEFRLTGGIDQAMNYMRASAYGKPLEKSPEDLTGAVVVFLHDFYDSPHVYHDLIFDDFWQWITFTIATLRESGKTFFLKPHPNQIALSGEALETLRAEHPGLRFLPPGITNTQLVEAGICCGVTMYGSVAHELAYYGVPTIGCARHPHNAFDFCRTARSKSEYRAFLLSPCEMPVPKSEMRQQALTFFYMHNLHGEPDDLELRSAFNAWWKACEGSGASTEELLGRFDAMRHSPAFIRFCSRLLGPLPNQEQKEVPENALVRAEPIHR